MTRQEILQIAKPILFNTQMVQAILDGHKTVTRRVVKPRYREGEYSWRVVRRKADGAVMYAEYLDEGGASTGRNLEPPYKPGDVLYVRETWGISNLNDETDTAYIVYKASENEQNEGCRAVKLPHEKFDKLYNSMAENSPDWRPSIHMPKEAARIFLKVTDVRIERLNAISQGQIIQEGIQAEYLLSSFHELWDSTIKPKDRDKYGWDANPWVWVAAFEREEG